MIKDVPEQIISLNEVRSIEGPRNPKTNSMNTRRSNNQKKTERRKSFKSEQDKIETKREVEPANRIDEETSLQQDISKYRKVSYQPGIKDKLETLINSAFTRIFYVLLTFYVLFADDVKFLVSDASSDIAFSIIAIIIMFIFFLEIVIYFIVSNDDYLCGLYFWIDVIGLLSMTLDIHWITEQVISYFLSFDEIRYGNKTQGLKRFSYGVRIITRSIRVIRAIRMMKLMKLRAGKKKTQTKEQEYKEVSKVGQKLEELTLKRVVILVLLTIVAMVFFNPSFYYEQQSSFDYGMTVLSKVPDDQPELLNFTFNNYVNHHRHGETPILYAQVKNLHYLSSNFTSNIRASEMLVVYKDCYSNQTKSTSGDILNFCIAIFDNRILVKFACSINIVKTISISIVLFGAIYCFSKDTSELVLDPIEKMTMKIKNLSNNPVAALQQNMDSNENSKSDGNKCCLWAKHAKETPLETALLEKTISKICALLSLGIGEAGAQIISTNMNTGIEGDINPVIPGKKVMAVYGFCDIRNFTDTTEVLQEKVMIFVNEISEIVHEITADYLGSANKNIGDAFLLVWKIDERFVDKVNGELQLKRCRQANQLMDMTLISFIKILMQVHKSYKLNFYRKDPALNKRMPNYSVKMGFGLHLGYSIEGAIGSMFKIDASYLSPNVNMASKLEEKTKEYDKQLILSGEFVKHLSDECKRYVRIIDQFSIDGEIVRFYTVDIDLNVLPIETENESEFKDYDLNKKMEKIKIKREQSKKLLEDVLNNRVDIWKEFELNVDFCKVRKKYNADFYINYNLGFDEYVKGNWTGAIEYFAEAQKCLGDNDVPIQNILKYMKSKNFVVPPNWTGAREEEEHGH